MKIVILFLTLMGLSAQAFLEEKTQFQVQEGLSLQGYIAKPEGAGPHPVVVMQMGHGQGTTDSDVRPYNPFAKLARTLADQGFLVLRFDKRGTGYNLKNGSYAESTLTDFVNDLKAAVRRIQRRPDVKAKEVFLLGHSLGGPIISIVANDFPEIQGVILSASPGRSFAEFNLEQMGYYYQWGEGLSGEALENAVQSEKMAGQLIHQPEEFCKQIPANCEKKNDQFYFWGQIAKYWQEAAALDPIALLKKLNCHVFSIQGTSDWIISSDNDGGAIQKALSTNDKFSSQTLIGMDHFLLKMGSKEEGVRQFVNGFKDFIMEIHPEYIPAVSSALYKWTYKK